MVNFDTFPKSVVLGYSAIDKCLWSEVLQLSVSTFSGPTLYLILQFMIMTFCTGIVNLGLRAFTIGLCYINIGALSIVNMDPEIRLDPA